MSRFLNRPKASTLLSTLGSRLSPYWDSSISCDTCFIVSDIRTSLYECMWLIQSFPIHGNIQKKRQTLRKKTWNIKTGFLVHFPFKNDYSINLEISDMNEITQKHKSKLVSISFFAKRQILIKLSVF